MIISTLLSSIPPFYTPELLCFSPAAFPSPGSIRKNIREFGSSFLTKKTIPASKQFFSEKKRRSSGIGVFLRCRK
jgi:hypothetical protein